MSDAMPPAEERPEPAQAATGPTVTTAPPPRTARRWSRIPSHVGPARMSTIVLAVLFVGIFVLYLFVRPPSTATAGTTSPTSGTGQTTNNAPAPTTTPPPTRTTTPTTPSHSSVTLPTGTTTGPPTAISTPSDTTGAPGGSSGGSTSIPSIPTSGSAPTS